MRKRDKGIGSLRDTFGSSWMKLTKRMRSIGQGSLEWIGCSKGIKTLNTFMLSQVKLEGGVG